MPASNSSTTGTSSSQTASAVRRRTAGSGGGGGGKKNGSGGGETGVSSGDDGGGAGPAIQSGRLAHAEAAGGATQTFGAVPSMASRTTTTNFCRPLPRTVSVASSSSPG